MKTTLRNAILPMLPALLLLACGGDERAVEGRGIYEHGVGESAGTASCVDVCDGQAPAGCWCDAQCGQFDDCCGDKATLCEPSPSEKCTHDGECVEGEYCKLKDGACFEPSFMHEQLEGICSERPEGCYEIFAPVCGCDSKTYGNDCEAAAAGVSVGSLGECPTPLPTGECYANADCAESEFCKLKEGECLAQPYSFAPIAGACTTMPDGCIEILSPVCGCDGNTYGNDCEAASAGVSVATLGECEPTPPPTKICYGNNDCAESEFCKYDDEACTWNTLVPLEGRCEDRPTGCFEIYAPVCGCDGKTYDNDCFAAGAGTSVASLGECD